MKPQSITTRQTNKIIMKNQLFSKIAQFALFLSLATLTVSSNVTIDPFTEAPLPVDTTTPFLDRAPVDAIAQFDNAPIDIVHPLHLCVFERVIVSKQLIDKDTNAFLVMMYNPHRQNVEMAALTHCAYAKDGWLPALQNHTLLVEVVRDMAKMEWYVLQMLTPQQLAQFNGAPIYRPPQQPRAQAWRPRQEAQWYPRHQWW